MRHPMRRPIRVLVVLGTRPEAIKLAPVIQELRRRPEQVICRVCVSGQHRQLVDQVLPVFDIRPDYDLDVMRPDQSPTQVAGAILAGLEPVLLAERPDWVLVQGDTTTVIAAALAAFYAGRRVGHVEAGLRTGDKWRPFPEEINRRVAGTIADLHFAPTAGARDNLIHEGVADARIVVTGNPVIDALRWVAAQPATADVDDLFRRCGLPGAGEEGADEALTILVTAHRRENFGAPLEQICVALREIATRFADRVRIVYPVHPNPSVAGPVHRMLGDVPGITLTPPLDYLPLVHLLMRSHLVLTDSGGLQEEAPSLGKPVLVLRQVTERPEGIAAGTVKVVGADRAVIVREAERLLNDAGAYQAMAGAVNPYGDGRAAPRIVDALLAEPDGMSPMGEKR